MQAAGRLCAIRKTLPPVFNTDLRVKDPNFQQIRPSLYENGALSNFKFNVQRSFDSLTH